MLIPSHTGFESTPERRQAPISTWLLANVVGLALLIILPGAARAQTPRFAPPPRHDSTTDAAADRPVVRTRQFVALLAAGSGEQRRYDDLEEREILEKFDELTAEGLTLVEFEVRTPEGKPPLYTGLWDEGEGKTRFLTGLELGEFESKMQELEAEGLRLEDFETFLTDGVFRYSGLWVEGEGHQELHVGYGDQREFEALQQARLWQGLRLIDLEYDHVGNTFAGLWREATPGAEALCDGVEVMLLGEDWLSFNSLLHDLARGGLRIDDLEVYERGEEARYAGVWHIGTGAYWHWLGTEQHCLESKAAWLRLSREEKEGNPPPRCRRQQPEDDHDHDHEPPPTKADPHTHVTGTTAHEPTLAPRGQEPVTQEGTEERTEAGTPNATPSPHTPAVSPVPALRIFDLELTPELPNPLYREHGQPLHVGVLHDSGSSGPGG